MAEKSKDGSHPSPIALWIASFHEREPGKKENLSSFNSVKANQFFLNFYILDKPVLCHWPLSIPLEKVRKQEIFWCFKGAYKDTSGMKWFKQNTLLNVLKVNKRCTIATSVVLLWYFFLTCLTFRIALNMLISYFLLIFSKYLSARNRIHLIFLHSLGAENTSWNRNTKTKNCK